MLLGVESLILPERPGPGHPDQLHRGQQGHGNDVVQQDQEADKDGKEVVMELLRKKTEKNLVYALGFFF